MPGHYRSSLSYSPKDEWYFTPYLEIGSRMELYIDGGIKSGSDIFKCLALGADFVFLGRGFLFSVPFG
jgi:dihydroorotate dehydrogenase